MSTPNPAYSRHLTLTNAAEASRAGITGAGVRIGVVDSGVMGNHPALSPRVVDKLVYVPSPPNNLRVDDVVGHGTAVSQIAAGTPFGAWPGGIAPGAQIVSARILYDKDPEDDGSGQGNSVDGALGMAPIHQDLINRGVRVMNNSWGGLYWTNPAATAPIASEYRPFIVSNDGLVVFATGNEAKANPSSMAALPSQPGPNGTLPAADLERGWLAVTAINPNNINQLDVDRNGAVYANACGVAMRYCLAAVGTVAATGKDDGPTSPTYWSWSGTSLAAPQVSGAAALVWQAFPYFNNDLVRQTLLGTARDIGTPGVDAVFGYGLLDVGKAIRGPARFDWGDVTVNINGATSTWSNTIFGNGGLIKQGTGTLVLNGSAQYTGATQVLGGTLRIGTGMISPVTIGPAGTLAIGSGGSSAGANAGNVVNQGTLLLDSGSSVITGNYQQSAAARMALMVGARLNVTGQAGLAGNLHVLGVLPGYVTSAREVFLNANSITGTFGSLTAQTGVLLNATPGYSTTQAWLDITRLEVTATAQSLGLSAESVGSAQRVEGAFDAIDSGQLGSGASSSSFLGGAGAIQGSPTAAAAERTLSSLSGELHTADSEFALMAIEGNRRALESRVDALLDAPAGGAWADELRSQRAMSRFDIDANGWMMGQDRRHGDRLTIGAALAETDGYAYHDQRFDRERNRQLEAQVYATYDLGAGYVLGNVAFGHMQRWTQRDVLLGDEAFRLGTDYSQRYASAAVQAGLPLRIGRGRLTPYAGVQSLRLDRDGFSEDGAVGFGLSTDASTMTLSQALFGARWSSQWSAGRSLWSLQGRVEWQRLLSQSGADVDARFTGLDVWSPIVGSALGRDIGVVGFGLGTVLPGGSRLGFDVDARHDQGETWSRAMLNWSTAW
ncbi:S8 family serine peptidase [Lysobacter panacisoli]|uniref:S8 family serine peptidase n=1 Tax=Lysobacter panacisoli TaxID=1255263 RepID=UPI001E5859CF|nr:S8 family serine peptidase [Lysobacter panacisoli]